jgi:hypothetical protein
LFPFIDWGVFWWTATVLLIFGALMTSVASAFTLRRHLAV